MNGQKREIMFKEALTEELRQSQYNNFGIENFDSHRFGTMPVEYKGPDTSMHLIKTTIKKIIGYDTLQQKKAFDEMVFNIFTALKGYEERLEFLYRHIPAESKNLLVKLIAYRCLGYTKVRLPVNNSAYWDALDVVNTLRYEDEFYDPHFMHLILRKYNLQKIGYDIKIFLSEVGMP